jgi:hypothetical protein
MDFLLDYAGELTLRSSSKPDIHQSGIQSHKNPFLTFKIVDKQPVERSPFNHARKGGQHAERLQI